jgi:hypothetical protein
MILCVPLQHVAGTMPLVAVDRFLDRCRDDPGTRTTYAETLTRLREVSGDQLPTGDLTPEVYEAVMAHWDTKAANTFNKHLSALNSFAAYTRRQEWLTTDPGRRLERRKVTRARDRAIPRARLERLFTDDRRHSASACCGGRSTRPAPGPRRSSAWTCRAWTWSSAAQAKSRHRHLATLGIYVQLGEETSARITAENDEHQRRRR